ncbi:MAG: hypothetical protein ACI9L9_002465, partial [Marivirga sp.]
AKIDAAASVFSFWGEQLLRTNRRRQAKRVGNFMNAVVFEANILRNYKKVILPLHWNEAFKGLRAYVISHFPLLLFSVRVIVRP